MNTGFRQGLVIPHVLGAAVFLQIIAGNSICRAQEKFQPILVETIGKGPGQKVSAFTVNPKAYKTRKNKILFVSAPTMAAISEESFASNAQKQKDVGREEGWNQFNTWFGGSAGVSTLFEHIGKFEGLGGVNNALTNLGLFMTVWQVGLDLSKGDNSAAGRSAYKGMLGFTVGKWGWSTLQAASVVWFVVDVTLNEVGTSAWLVKTDYWRQVYQAYYQQHDLRAKRAERGPRSGYLTPTLEEAYQEIRNRPEGGRTLNEWKVLLTFFYKEATKPERFSALVDAEIEGYVKLFWISNRFDEFVAEFGRGQVGLTKGAGLNDKIRRAIEAEHKATLKAKLAKDVLPEIAHRAWIDALEGEAARLNRELRPQLNQTIEIEVSAYNLKAPARILMPLPGGGKWSGTLEPGRTRKLKITKLAFLRAGLPDKVLLEQDGRQDEKPIVFSGDTGTATFGRPSATIVSVMTKTEGPQACVILTKHPDGSMSSRTEERPGQFAPVVHTAISPDLKEILFGQYDPAGGWRISSPGAPGKANSLQFAAPYFENLTELSSCSGTFLQGDILGDAICQATRQMISKSRDGTEIETTCTSQMKLSLKGVYMPQGGTQGYVALDGPQGQVLRDTLKEAMSKGLAIPGVR